MVVVEKRLTLYHDVASRGEHHQHFAGSVMCRFILTAKELVVDFIDAQELRDINVPLSMNSLSPKFVLAALTMLVVYFVFGIVFFAYVPMDAISNSVTRTCSNASGGKWAVVETGPSSEWEETSVDRLVSSFYFTVVVFTSVGFGDIIISNRMPWLRGISIIFVLWGTVTLGLMLHLGTWAQDHIMNKVGELKQRCDRKSATAVAPSATAAKKKSPKRQHLMWLEVRVALGLFLALILLGMFIYSLDKYVFQEPDPDTTAGEKFVDALYFAVISCTTIGYGDETPASTAGRLLCGFFLVLALPIFGNTVAVLASVPSTRRQLNAEATVLAQYGPDLDGDELRSLISSAGKGSTSCTRAQFILTMLLKQAKVTPSDIKNIGNTFDALDDDNSGYLDSKDVDEDPSKNKTKSTVVEV